MKSIVNREIRVKLDSEPRIRRAWLSPGKPRFLALILDNGNGVVKAVQHEERFELPQLGKVNAFAFNPGSEVSSAELAVAKDSGVERYDLDAGIRFMDLDIFRASSVAYSSCGRLIAAGSSSGQVKVFALNGSKPAEVLCINVGRSAIAGLAFSATADRLFISERSGKLYSIELLVENATAQVYLQQHGEDLIDQDIYCIASHPSASLLACAGNGNQVNLVDTSCLNLRSIDANVGAIVKHIEILANSTQMVVIGSEGGEIWSIASGELRKQDSIELSEGERVLAVQHYGSELFVVTQ